MGIEQEAGALVLAVAREIATAIGLVLTRLTIAGEGETLDDYGALDRRCVLSLPWRRWAALESPRPSQALRRELLPRRMRLREDWLTGDEQELVVVLCGVRSLSERLSCCFVFHHHWRALALEPDQLLSLCCEVLLERVLRETHRSLRVLFWVVEWWGALRRRKGDLFGAARWARPVDGRSGRHSRR